MAFIRINVRYSPSRSHEAHWCAHRDTFPWGPVGFHSLVIFPLLIPAGYLRNKAVCQAAFLSQVECDRPSQWKAFKWAAWGILPQNLPHLNGNRAAPIQPGQADPRECSQLECPLDWTNPKGSPYSAGKKLWDWFYSKSPVRGTCLWQQEGFVPKCCDTATLCAQCGE